jgi:phage terminase small subunit
MITEPPTGLHLAEAPAHLSAEAADFWRRMVGEYRFEAPGRALLWIARVN